MADECEGAEKLESLSLVSKGEIIISDVGEISGIAWPFGSADSHGDMIKPGAFVIPQALPICLEHDKSKAIGVWETVSETNKGLEVKGRLFLEGITSAKSAHRYLKAGAIKGLSIGISDGTGHRLPDGKRMITQAYISEISVCRNPVHPDARITAVKSNPVTSESVTMENEELTVEAEDKVKPNQEVQELRTRIQALEAKSQRLNVQADKAEKAETKAYLEAMHMAGMSFGGLNKALTIAGDAPGYVMVPEQITREFLHNLLDYSPVRTLADVRQAASHTVKIPIRTGVTNAQWVGETAARTGSEPTFDEMSISIKEIGTFVDISLQAMQDSDIAAEEIALALAEDFGEKEARALVVGGAGAQAALEPQGIMTNSTIATYANGHAANLSADALIRMMYKLRGRYRNKGVWLMNGDTLGVLRTLKDGEGNHIWKRDYTAGQPETILGQPVLEAEHMPGIAANATPILFGDFKAGYRVYDRLDLDTLGDPYTQRINGMYRIHARRRFGAGVVRPDAFIKLRMATS